MDLDPFVPVGITADTVRFLDVFLLHCLLADSPPDTPAEIAELGRNQDRVAARGREPDLALERDGQTVALRTWAADLLSELVPVAEAMDAAQGGQAYRSALQNASGALQAPDTLPSARILAAMSRDHGDSFLQFVRAQSSATRQAILALPYADALQERFEGMTRASMGEQKRIESLDTMPFELYRQQYVSPDRLQVRHRAVRAA